MSHSPNDLKEAVARKGSFSQTLKAVFWSFFGVRKASDHAQDIAKINPVHVIIAGVIGGLLFVLMLILIVKLVVAQAVA